MFPFIAFALATVQSPDLASVLKPTPIVDPALAASPQRELFRAWDQCLLEGKLFGGLETRDADAILTFAFSQCEPLESRLTGELVRQFGYQRGMQVAQRTKRKITSDWKDQLAQFSVGLNRGWEIRPSESRCAAIRADNANAPYYPATVVTQENQTYIGFQVSLPEQTVAKVSPGRIQMIVSLVPKAGEPYSIGQRTFVLHSQGKAILEFASPLTERDKQSLKNAEYVKLVFLSDLKPVKALFPVSEIAEVFPKLSQCKKSLRSGPTKK
jgi:hypothetical protein